MQREPMDSVSYDGYYYLTDKYGHVVADDGSITDPYGGGEGITLSLLDLPEDQAWDGSDVICFDYMILEAHTVIHAVIDCDSGGFIEDFDYAVVKHSEAVATLDAMIDSAWEWFGENHPGLFDKVEGVGLEHIRTQLYNSIMHYRFDQDVEGVDYWRED